MTDARHRVVLADHMPLVPGPGALGRGGAPAAVLFAAGHGFAAADLLAAFWADEASRLDWRRDFLCDPVVDAFLNRLADPPDEDEEEEILYSRSQLTTLGSDIIDP